MKKTLAISAVIVVPLLGLMGWGVVSSSNGDLSEADVMFLIVMFFSFGLPITALVDAARVPSDGWKRAGLDKTTWIVLVIVGSFVGAIAYFGWIRRRLPSPG